MQDYKTLKYHCENGIAQVVINRPEVLNALNSTVFTELKQIFTRLEKLDEARVIILTGQGERAFAAGSDVSEFANCSFIEAREISIRNNAAQQAIACINKPTIAALNGFTLGGGLEVAMCCDIRIAADRAKFGQPEIGLGFIPGGGGTQRLARLVGVGIAKELIFSGKIIDASEAYRIGLVNQIVSSERLISSAIEMAETFANKSRLILEFAKVAIDKGIELDLVSGLQLETELWAASFATQDHHEGIKAFLEKRQPQFIDK